MAQQRLHTSWQPAHHSSWSSSFALQRHLLSHGTGIESGEQLVNGGARGCAAEAFTLAAVLHRWRSSQAWPSSDSTPAGMQRITRPGHLASRCSAIYSGTTWASEAVSGS